MLTFLIAFAFGAVGYWAVANFWRRWKVSREDVLGDDNFDADPR